MTGEDEVITHKMLYYSPKKRRMELTSTMGRSTKLHTSIVLLVILLWPSAVTAPHVNHHLVRRQATPTPPLTPPPQPAGVSSGSVHTGAPPPGGAPPVVGRGQRGASVGEEGEVGKEESPAPTANLPQPVSDGSNLSGSLHPGIIVVLSLVCVFLFVLLLVCTAALVRYTVVNKRKGRHNFQNNVRGSGGDNLWTEGARYSPATPHLQTYRHRASNRGPSKLSVTSDSQISTELYRAVYPFRPTEDTQLGLQPGSVVEVVEKTAGWWRGYAGPHEGWFPANYVERVYEGSCITLDDYTDTMGARHSRHLRPGHHTTTRLSPTATTPGSTPGRPRGLDEVDFQAVSTPISKDYCKLEPLENSLQPIPLAESFGEDEPRNISSGLSSKDTSQNFNTTNHLGSRDTSQNFNTANDPEPVEEAQAAVPSEDTYMNCDSEVHLVQVEEDMYINCQAELHEATLEEEQAHEDMEKVQRELDRVLQDGEEESEPEMSDTDEPVDKLNLSYRVLYGYHPRRQDELHIRPNELVTHVSTETADWVRVRNTSGQEGLVPCIYVSPEQKDSHSVKRNSLRRHRSPETPDSDDWDNEFDNDIEGDITAIEYAVIYDYEAQQDGDLSLRVGDRVAVTETQQSGWWKGFSCGREGWFPASYVEMATSDSTPNTPAATMTTSPFTSLTADQHNSLALELIRLKEVVNKPNDDDEDNPPPLPTSPPPTDEELEELERQIEKEKQKTVELSHPQHYITPTKSVVKGNTCERNVGGTTPDGSDHGVGRPVSSSEFEHAGGQQKTVPGFRGFTAINEVVPEAEESPPRVLRPPPGFGGSDAAISSTDDSEPEKSRFKLTKRFGKPKFVKIPKKLLPQMRRVGSMGKRPAPPAPQAKKRPVLEISAPILQQVSDPTRIAASQELRVSFQEPVADGKSSSSKDTTTSSSKDSPANGSPGILKKKPAFIYKSPHGGSYEDMIDKRSSEHNCDNSLYDVPKPARPVSQVSSNSVASSSSGGRPQNQQQAVQRQNSAQSIDRRPSDSRKPSRQSSITKPNKTPPPRPRPISGTPMSAPPTGQNTSQRPPFRQSVSMTNSPTVHHSSGAVYRQSSLAEHPVSTEDHPEFTPGPQPQRGRRRSHRPSGPPPPRPKMPPPPRPPGPPPGRVGAHGDGMHLERHHSGNTRMQGPNHWVHLNGLDSSQTSTDGNPQTVSVDRRASQNPEDMNNSVASQRSAGPQQGKEGRVGAYIDLQDSVQSVAADRTFTVPTPKGILHTNKNIDHKVSDSGHQNVSSHLTESTDFDEVDCSGARFEVIAMSSPSKKLHPGPRDSFRKYKKEKGGGKRTSFTEDKSLSALNAKTAVQQSNSSQAAVARSKAKSQTLPNSPSPSNRNPRGEELSNQHESHKPRSLTLGRTEGTVTGPVSDLWCDPTESPTKRPPRPPLPLVSPTSPNKKFPPQAYNGESGHLARSEKPVKPPRKDKIRRSTENYLATEKGELSFEEDAVIRDIGEIPDRPGWSVGMLEDGMIGVYPTNTAVTLTSLHLNESD